MNRNHRVLIFLTVVLASQVSILNAKPLLSSSEDDAQIENPQGPSSLLSSIPTKIDSDETGGDEAEKTPVIVVVSRLRSPTKRYDEGGRQPLRPMRFGKRTTVLLAQNDLLGHLLRDYLNRSTVS